MSHKIYVPDVAHNFADCSIFGVIEKCFFGKIQFTSVFLAKFSKIDTRGQFQQDSTSSLSASSLMPIILTHSAECTT